MSGLEWLLVGMGPIAVLISLYLLFLKGVVHNRISLLDRVDQLGHRLHERLLDQRSEQNQELSSITQDVLEILQESEEQRQATESSDLSSGLSSILPAKESIAAVSKRLSAMDQERVSQNDTQSLNLASLAVAYVRLHLDEVIRVEHIANELSVTSDQLYVYLKEGLGCSAQELITVIKMKEAKKLLASGNLLVKNVANQLGFWSPYHFSSRFKTFFGLSPKEYKKQVQERKQRKASKTGFDYRLDATKTVNKQEDTQYQTEEVISEKSEETQDLPPGTVVDRFLIVNRIGHGGMGVVYKAYDPKLNRGVALKLLRADQAKSEQLQNRLLREAQALARLSHPNVLHVYDVGTYGDQIFMTMALVEGQTLKEWLVDEKRSVKEILKVMIAAGRGLSAAHRAGLIHRDFKPSNVIVGDDGQVRVLDFGLACTTSVQESHEDVEGQRKETDFAEKFNEFSSAESTDMLLTPLTRAGNILGTPMYMAPEQHLGLKTDERTDQFGFCVVLYEALYGKRPFSGRSIGKLKHEVIREQVCPPPAKTDVQTWIWQIVRKGLSSKPEERHPNIDSLLDALGVDLEKRRIARKKKQLWFVLIVFFSMLPFGIWYSFFQAAKLCTGAEEKMLKVWNPKVMAAVKRALLESKLAYAKDTQVKLQNLLDNYSYNWIAAHIDACEATNVRGELSSEILDLRMGCLRASLRELSALIEVFTTADDKVISRSIKAAVGLPNLSDCNNIELLQAKMRPSYVDEKTKKQNLAIQERLAKAKALRVGGHYEKALKEARSVLSETQKLQQPQLGIETNLVIGQTLLNMGDFEGSKEKFKKAYYEAVVSGDDFNALRAANHLIFTAGDRLADYKTGEQWYWFATMMQRRLRLGVNHLEVAKSFHNLASVQLGQDLYEKSLETYQKALAIRERILPPDHPVLASSFNNIGLVYWNLGKYKKALVAFSRTLDIEKQALGAEHPDVGGTLNNMGMVYRDQGNLVKGMELFQQAVTIREKSLGKEHPYLANVLNNLGILYLRQGNFLSARKALERSLMIFEKSQGTYHPRVASALINLGAVFLGKGDYAKAEDYYKRSLIINERILGVDHPEIANSLAGLGELLLAQGKLFQAQAKFKRVADICGKKICSEGSYCIALFVLAKTSKKNTSNASRVLEIDKKAELECQKSTFLRRRLNKISRWLDKYKN